jgi:hypothetical protein
MIKYALTIFYQFFQVLYLKEVLIFEKNSHTLLVETPQAGQSQPRQENVSVLWNEFPTD